MCLKEYYVITFSNREAYERMLKKIYSDLEPYESASAVKKGKPIVGLIKVVREFLLFEANGWNWNSFSFEQLERMEHAGGFFSVYYYQFWDWTSFAKRIEDIGQAEYLFGKVTVELR